MDSQGLIQVVTRTAIGLSLSLSLPPLVLVGSGRGRNDLLVTEVRSATTLIASNVAAGTYFVRVQALTRAGKAGRRMKRS